MAAARFVERGLQARRAGDHAAALSLFRDAIAAGAANSRPYLLAAGELQALGRDDEAEAMCLAALGAEPENVAALVFLGRSERGRGAASGGAGLVPPRSRHRRRRGERAGAAG